MDARKFFSEMVETYIAAIEAEVRGVRAQKDIEPLHRMRVSLRRMKSFVSDFREVVPVRDYDAAVAHMRRLLRALGSARDVDTKLECLRVLYADDAARPFRVGIREIIEELEEDRGEMQPKIVKNLTRTSRRALFKSVRRLDPTLEDDGITLEDWGKNCVIDRLEKLFSLEPYMRRSACVKELHEMRIAAKNLRYTLESFEPVYGRRVRPFAESAMEVQRAIGAVHNFDVWLGLIRILKDSSGRDAHFCKAVNFLMKEFGARRETAYADLLERWAVLKKKKAWAHLSFFALDRK
jgi:CHAD domain-containing protein